MAAADTMTWTSSGRTTHLRTINDQHNILPSKVIHCRAVPVGCRETDLVQVMKLFGNVKALKLMPKVSQGLVEFEELESSVACVTYGRLQPILIMGRQVYVNYSKSTEISVDTMSSHEQIPSNVLLLTIVNVMHPITVETIQKICEQKNIEVQRIVIFHKNGLQALVEFKTIDEATQILQVLNGCDIYPGCCTLKIEFSKSEKLNVQCTSNTSELYNIDTNERKHRDFRNDKMTREFSDNPVVQNIISRVMSGGSMNGNQAIIPAGVKSLLTTTSNGMENRGASLLHKGHIDMYTNQNQPDYLDQYTSPFCSGGGDGCVAMVYGISNDIMNCDHLFNLFCLYGNVIKTKILVNKTSSAMVQYADRLSTDLAIQYLNDITLFGEQLQLAVSKHPSIVDSSQTSTLFDGSLSVINYYSSRNNRFKFVPGGRNDLFSRIHPPSKVLHYFNAPPDCTEQRLEELFESLNAEVPLKQASVSKPGGKSSSGLLEFSSISSATEALVLVNHVTLHKEDGYVESMGEKPGAPFTFKLAFSTSHAINK